MIMLLLVCTYIGAILQRRIKVMFRQNCGNITENIGNYCPNCVVEVLQHRDLFKSNGADGKRWLKITLLIVAVAIAFGLVFLKNII